MAFFRLRPLAQRPGANQSDFFVKTGWISVQKGNGRQNILHFGNSRQAAFATPNLLGWGLWACNGMMNSRQKVPDDDHDGRRFFSDEWRRKKDHYSKKAKELGMRSR
jgi:hypothetical protein